MDFLTLCITEDETILEGMKRLDITAKKIIFVADGKKLLATVTDGDIRRHLLKGGQLDDEIKNIANYKPKYVQAKDIDTAKKIMCKYNISSLPIVNDKMELQRVIFADNTNIRKKARLDVPVVIMAGGKGTRLYPYTKVLPKPLIPIGDLPIAEHIMNKFIEFGCDNFHYVLNHKKQMIKAYFSEEASEYKISFYDEEAPLGTGGGLSLLKGLINSTFFLTNCDSILNADYDDIYKYHKEQGNTVTMVCVYKHLTVPYGVVSMGEKGEFLDIKEKPEYSFLTNTGFYIVEPTVFYEIEDNTAIGFPEIVDKLRKKEMKIGIYPVSEMSWLDMGQPDEMEKMCSLIEKAE